MAKRRIWVGLDVGNDQIQLCAIDSKERVIREVAVPTEQAALAQSLVISGCTVEKIALEAGALSIHLVRHLTEAGFQVDCYEARQISRYLRVRVNKTDTNDARGLAEIAKRGPNSLSTVHTKKPENQRVRSKLVFRHKLTLHRMAGESMIKSFIRLNGGKVPRAKTAATLEKNVRHELKRMRSEVGVDLEEEILPLLKLTMSLRAYLADLDRNMKHWAERHPVCARMMKIPGVGPITAASFCSAVDDPDRFRRAKDVGAYFGLTPIVHQSGKTLKHGRISKRGNKLTRSHLTLAASSILNVASDGPLKAWGKNIAERAGPGKARVALARKLAVIMLAVWKSGEKYDPDHSENRALQE